MIKGMNHVGISISNLDRAIGFYRDLLGMEVLFRGTFDGERYETMMDLKGARGRGAMLRLNDLQIELFEFERPFPKPANPDRPVCDHGITHFCMSVDDIEDEYARLKAAGVHFHCPPLTFSGTGNKATYGRDPDGNVFELHEQAKAREK